MALLSVISTYNVILPRLFTRCNRVQKVLKKKILNCPRNFDKNGSIFETFPGNLRTQHKKSIEKEVFMTKKN